MRQLQEDLQIADRAKVIQLWKKLHMEVMKQDNQLKQRRQNMNLVRMVNWEQAGEEEKKEVENALLCQESHQKSMQRGHSYQLRWSWDVTATKSASRVLLRHDKCTTLENRSWLGLLIMRRPSKDTSENKSRVLDIQDEKIKDLTPSQSRREETAIDHSQKDFVVLQQAMFEWLE